MFTPDLSPIPGGNIDASKKEKMQIKLNVDSEVQKNFKFIELGMTKALERIVS